VGLEHTVGLQSQVQRGEETSRDLAVSAKVTRFSALSDQEAKEPRHSPRNVLV
jgi:hypothetical protein